jgi:hypothetical protein
MFGLMSDTTLSGVTCTNCSTAGITTNFCPNCGGPVQISPTTAPPGYGPPPAAAQPVFAAPAPERKHTWIKVLLILGACFLVLVGGCAALIGSAANEVSKELAEDSSGDVSDPSEVKATASLNEPLSLKGTTYKVTDVRTADSVGDSYSRERANGTFVIVDVQLTNEKKEPATIMANALTLVGGNGSAYSTSDDAFLALDDELILEEIQPGVSERGKLVYDLPPSAVKGAELQVEDLFSDDKGRIKLGL